MAAKTLNAEQLNRTLNIKNKKITKLKSVLCNPFEIKWPRLHLELVETIKKELISVMSQFTPLRNAKRGSVRKKTVDPGNAKVIVTDGKKAKTAEKEGRSQGKDIRPSIVVGLNAVTRALEKDTLAALLVNSSTRPLLLTSHLLVTAASRECPAVSLLGLAEAAGPRLGLQSVIAIGIKKSCDSAFGSVIQLIRDKAPSLEVPWITPASTLEQSSSDEITEANTISQPDPQPEDTSASIRYVNSTVLEVETPLTDVTTDATASANSTARESTEYDVSDRLPQESDKQDREALKRKRKPLDESEESDKARKKKKSKKNIELMPVLETREADAAAYRKTKVVKVQPREGKIKKKKKLKKMFK